MSLLSARQTKKLQKLIKLSLGALKVDLTFSLDDVHHWGCETSYLPDRKQKWYVNLTWDFTLQPGHQPIFLTTRPYEPPHVLCQSEATSQDDQRSPQSICRAQSLRAAGKIIISRCTSGGCKGSLWCQRISVVLSHLAPNTITVQMLNTFTKWAISCKMGWKLHLSPPMMICIEK